MKLYVLRRRWGGYHTSVRDPDVAPSWDVILAGVGPWSDVDWLIPPSGVAMSGAIWVARIIYARGFLYLGLRGTDLSLYVAAKYTSLRLAYNAALLTSKMISYVVLPATVLLMVYLANPTTREFVWDETFPWRYIMTFLDEMFFADVAYIDEHGKAYYIICSRISATRFWETWNQTYIGETVDYWRMEGTWIQRKDQFFFHEQWLWDHVWVKYIGHMHHVSATTYVLQSGFIDPYVQDIEWPWTPPEGFLCRDTLKVP